jgi:Tfp pilus assembly protein PilE
MYCKKCGTQNDDNAFKCTNCGEVIQQIGTEKTQPAQQVSSHLAPAILVTIFCCLPFGIPAIVFAAQVNGKLAAGDYAGALKASGNAKIWCWVAFAVGIVFTIGMLASIAIPQFAVYRMRSYNATAQADLRSAATAQEAYYKDNQKYSDSIENLKGTYGFSPSQDVEIEIISAETENFVMVGFHKAGNKKYQITGPEGEISEYSESSPQ